MTQLAPRRRDVLTMVAAAGFPTQPKAGPMTRSSPVVELRQYTTRPGRRDDLIALFDREFVKPQEADGIEVIGQFRDLDDPNRFVWLRGFPDMPARAAALTAFYGGPAWLARRDAANATILDSDNVLLLRPLGSDGGFELARRAPDGFVSVEIRYLGRAALPAFASFFTEHVRPRITQAGARVLATFVTEQSPNNFRLPVRETSACWSRSWASRTSRPTPPTRASSHAAPTGAPKRRKICLPSSPASPRCCASPPPPARASAARSVLPIVLFLF
jgi:hypothetical protein